MPGRVLRIVTRLNRGGPLRQLCALMPGLSALGWEGPIAVGAVAGSESDGGRDLEQAGVALLRVPTLGRSLNPARDARALKALLAIIRRVRPDVIHTHMAKAGALGRMAARISRVPCVHTLHGHHFDLDLLRGCTARWTERRLARWTARIICLTPRQARDVTHVHAVAPSQRVRVVAPGLDLDALERAARVPLPMHARPSAGEVRFVWTGRFVAVKDPHLLLAAAGRARVPWTLWMLGDGPLRASVRETIARRGLGARLRAPGAVAEVAPFVQQSAGLVLASRSEGASLSAIEAMALGRPVVTSTVGGMPDLLTHEAEGLWVAPADPLGLAQALDRLAGDAALRARLGAAGKLRAQARHGAALLAGATAAVYQEALKEGPRGG